MPTQTRTICGDCGLEVVYRTAASGPAGNCPKCGSSSFNRVTFAGLFDASSDPDDIARRMVGVVIGPDEDAKRAALVGRVDVLEPPMTLGVSVDLLVGEALSGAGPAERPWYAETWAAEGAAWR